MAATLRSAVAAPRWLMSVVVLAHAGAIWQLAKSGAHVAVPAPVLAVDWIPAPAPAPAPATAAPPVPARRSPVTAARPTPTPDATLPVGMHESPAAGIAPSAPAAPMVAATTETIPVFDAAYLHNAPPAYPPLSRRLGEQGKVQLRVFVDADGRAETVEVKIGSGSPRLDAAALEAVRQWRFAPAKRGDATVGAWVVVPIVFHLER